LKAQFTKLDVTTILASQKLYKIELNVLCFCEIQVLLARLAICHQKCCGRTRMASPLMFGLVVCPIICLMC